MVGFFTLWMLYGCHFFLFFPLLILLYVFTREKKEKYHIFHESLDLVVGFVEEHDEFLILFFASVNLLLDKDVADLLECFLKKFMVMQQRNQENKLIRVTIFFKFCYTVVSLYNYVNFALFVLLYIRVQQPPWLEFNLVDFRALS